MSQASSDSAELTAAGPRVGWFAFLVLGTGVVGLALGAAAGTVALLLYPSYEGGSDLAQPLASTSPETKDFLARADEKLLERDYAKALTWYRGGLGPHPEPTVQLRIGICLDGLGQWTEAQRTYAELVQRYPGTPLAFASQVALARLEYRLGRPRSASKHLAQALISAPEHVVRLSAVINTVRLEYMAWKLLQEPIVPPSILEPNVLLPSWELEPPENIWRWLRQLGEQALRPWPVASETVDLVDMGAPETILARVHLASTSLTNLLQRLALEAGLELHIAPPAQALLSERSVYNVRIENWPFGEILALLADLADCEWYRDGKRLHILAAEQRLASDGLLPELSIAHLRRSLYQAGLATCQRLLLASHEVPGAEVHRIFWLQGLCYYHLGQRSEASTWWERFLLRWPQRTEAFYVSFNLGVLCWQEGDTETAKRMWIRAADQAPDHRATGLAYFYAGRTELERLQVAEALPWLRRAANATAPQEVRLAALLLLAASYVYLDNPAAGHQVLVSNRRGFQAEPFRSCAAFLDALARLRMSMERSALRREAEDLLAALLQVPDWRLLEPLGPLLAGQAWMRLQLPEQAYRVYRLVLPRARSLWRSELLLAYGEACLQLNRHEEIGQIASELTSSSDSSWSSAVHWLLARSAFQQGDYQQTIEHAHQVLLRPGKIQRESVLRLLGEAYSGLGDHRRAAECYAGRFPEP